MPLSLSLEDGPQQFVVFQQPIHGPHPWLPQLSHFFGKQRLPQARLLMSHANHDTKTIQNRIWLFWFDFVGPIPICPSANGAVLHREVARGSPVLSLDMLIPAVHPAPLRCAACLAS